MSQYQHKRGQIKDNAIEALLHDPLFRQRVEKIRKEKEAILGKENIKEMVTGRPVVISYSTYYHWLFSYYFLFCSFNKSRISDNKTSSLLGAGGASGSASFSRRTLFITLIAMKIANATITKSNTV